MLTTIDITDDDVSGGSTMPSPSSVTAEDDDMVVQLREVELRMTFFQLLQLHETIGAFVLRDGRVPIEMGEEAEELLAAKEHAFLHKLVRKLMGDEFTVDVPEPLRRALLDEVVRAGYDAESWPRAQRELLLAKKRIAELEKENEALRARKRPPTTR